MVRKYLPTDDTYCLDDTTYWIKVNGFCTPGGDPVWKCAKCGKGIHVYGIEHVSYGKDVSDHQWVACPNCGRKVIGEKFD